MQKIESYALEWSHFCIGEIFPIFQHTFQVLKILKKVALKKVQSHATILLWKQTRQNHGEKCYIFTLDANWKTPELAVNQKIEESLRVVHILKITQ